MKRIFVLSFFILVSLIFPRNAHAIYDPTSVSNNRVGMHIIDSGNLPQVRDLVNSTGGDWGYVTLVIQKGERNPTRWQTVFDDMRRFHLIPIIRIATAPVAGNNNVWEKPNVDEIDGWVSFLNSLNWVIKNRYVIVGNEPNHANEWGGEVNPKEYADYLKIFSQKLKNSNEDFFIMPAGLDASVPNIILRSMSPSGAMEESLFLSKMFEEDSGVFDFIDGWSSHSYPNPAFSGAPTDTGKGSIRTYEWELNYLKFLGLKRDLPVFITETGWIHGTDLTTNIPPKIEYAFKNVWNDKRVVAVTPFIFKYTDPPFDGFSWVNKEGKYYDFYYTVLNLLKEKGQPIQEEKGDIITAFFPKIAMVNTQFHGVLFVKNIGQSIWDKNDLMIVDNNENSLQVNSILPEVVEPGQIAVITVTGKFPGTAGTYNVSLRMTRDSKSITEAHEVDVNLIPGVPTVSDILDYVKTVILRRIGLFMVKFSR